MIPKKTILALAGVLSLALTGCSSEKDNLTRYVDPFIGTGGHGHTYPGAVAPRGLVQLSPDTRLTGWDACAGYHYDDRSLLGFSHTHLSGTGIGDYGDILFLPFSGEPVVVEPNGEDRQARFGSAFSHKKESASPGYYSVYLEDYKIQAELTATAHTGFHRYTYPKNDTLGLLIDLTTTIHDRMLADSKLEIVNPAEIRGMKHVKGWAPNRHVYFHAKFSQPFRCVENDNKRMRLLFDKSVKGKQVLAKVGISFVDEEGARNNADKEIADWDFERVRKETRCAWNKQLSGIKVKTDDKKSKTIFYTALYHTLLEPAVCSDVDGRYRTMENKIETSGDYTNYTVFSLWDTFRTLHPLYTILTPGENEAMIRSLIKKSEEGGLLPMWELASNETGCMIGYHAVPVIVDAYMKGYRDFDVRKAYEACKKASSYDTVNVSPAIDRNILKNQLMPPGKYYKNTIGYIPSDKDDESVAKALEYAYNDWLIAQFAKALGEEEDYAHYMELSKNYKHYFDKETGFMRGKMSDGTWKTPFNPRGSNHRGDDYCEGNAWQWTWFVPHDVDGLATLMGGREEFIVKLDSLFSITSELEGENVSADISGMIGQYAHGNEPSHQIIHMYNSVGQAWKTQELTDRVLRTLYFDEPDGLSGNEDCGQMSAWYILNSMGFYSYCPGIPYYSIGRPLFDEVAIALENGNTFTIRANNNSPSNKYIESVTLNGTSLDVLFFSHRDLMKGGLLEINMTGSPTEKLK